MNDVLDQWLYAIYRRSLRFDVQRYTSGRRSKRVPSPGANKFNDGPVPIEQYIGFDDEAHSVQRPVVMRSTASLISGLDVLT